MSIFDIFSPDFYKQHYGNTRGEDRATGVANFGVVVDGKVFRGAAPSCGEIERLFLDRRVNLILDLRSEAKDEIPARLAKEVRYVQLALDDKAKALDLKTIELAADVVMKAARSTDTRVFVHCAGGRHRTSAVIALVRHLLSHWQNDAIWKEQRSYGLYKEFGHEAYYDYIRHMGVN